MEKADLDRAGEILFASFNDGASKHGYAPRVRSVHEGKAWAWALLRHGPRELLVAEVERRVVALCCLNRRGAHGGIGPVAVDPAFQGQGIGRHMMTDLLTRAEDLQSVRLFQEAFNAASFSLYYSLGFMPAAELLDLALCAGSRKEQHRTGTVYEASANDLDAVLAYDAPRSGLERRADLAYYAQWGKVLVYRDGRRLRGFLACLPGSQSVQLGPLVADGEDEAACLFHSAAGAFSGRACQTRVMARDASLFRTLAASGFKLYCVDLLMVRGSWRPGRSVEAFGRFPEGA